MSTANAFNWREFTQPVAAKKSAPVRGYERPGFVEPRKIIQSDASGKRLALNSAGRLVKVAMHVPGPGIAPKSDRWGEYL